MISEALSALKPDGQWSVDNEDLNKITWHDKTQLRPTDAEINAKVLELQSINIASKSRKAARKNLDIGLGEMELDLGDGRIVQTRPQDQQNIMAKIEVINAGGSDRFIMKNNTIHSVTVAELQQALQSGITKGSILYEQYMDTLM